MVRDLVEIESGERGDLVTDRHSAGLSGPGPFEAGADLLGDGGAVEEFAAVDLASALGNLRADGIPLGLHAAVLGGEETQAVADEVVGGRELPGFHA
jgi:hypothetical protein